MSASLSGTLRCGFHVEAAVAWKRCIITVALRGVPRGFFSGFHNMYGPRGVAAGAGLRE